MSKFLARCAVIASGALMAAAPAMAQQSTHVLKTQHRPVVKLHKPATPHAGPTTRDHRKTADANTRDHRSSNAPGGVTVTAGRKRGGGKECVKFILGGECHGGAALKAAKAGRYLYDKSSIPEHIKGAKMLGRGVKTLIPGGSGAKNPKSVKSNPRDHRKQ